MLTSLEGPNGLELMSTGHVDRLLSKLPKYLRDGFIEHLQARGRLQTYNLNPYNFWDFAEWLRVKAEVQRLSSRLAQRTLPERSSTGKGDKHVQKPRNQTPVAIYHGKSDTSTAEPVPQTQSGPSNPKSKKAAKLCLFCKDNHYLSQCSTIITQTADQIETWIAE